MILIQGSLEGISFTRLARSLATLARDASLDVRHNGWHGVVLFEGGCPVAASVEGEQGQTALEFIALALNAGEFEFSDKRVPIRPNLEADAGTLWVHLEALEAARPRLADPLPPPNAVPKVRDEPDEPGQRAVAISRQTLAVLLEIDGRRTAREIAARRGLWATITALDRLAELGWVAVDAVQPVPPAPVLVDHAVDGRRSRPQALPWPHYARGWLTRAGAGAWRTPWALALTVGLVTVLLHGHRLSAAPDLLSDEGLYLAVGDNLARGAGLLSPDGTPFFWHPPAYFLVEALYLKLAGLADVDPISAIYSVRWLNVLFSAATAGLLLLFGRRLHGYKAGLLMAGIFVLDPYVQRINRRGMLETLAMLLALTGLYVFFSARQRLSARQEVAAGLVLGLAMLTKELMAFELLAIIGFAVWSRRSHLANAVRVSLLACLVYLTYPIWAVAIGQGDAYFSLKLQRLSVFVNWPRYWSLLNHQAPAEPAAAISTGSGARFVDNILVVLAQYVTSYFLIAVGGLLTLALLLWFRSQLSTRYVATWGGVSYAVLGLALAFGMISDQFFYYLIVPAIVVTAYTVAHLNASHTRAGVALFGVLILSSYDVYQWIDKYHFGNDNVYASIFHYIRANVPPGETISVGNDVSNYLLPGYDIAFHRDKESAIATHVRYFILSSKDPWGGFHGMTPQFYKWAIQQSRPLVEQDETTHWKLGLYYRDPTHDEPAQPGAPARAPVPAHLLLDEVFGVPQPGWPDDPGSTAWFGTDGYHLVTRAPGHFVAVGTPTSGELSRVVVRATFRKIGGPPGGGYGLLLRDQGPGPRDGLNQTGRYYVLEVGDRGEVGIWRRDLDHWVDLLPWTATPAVRPGYQSNELEAWASGEELALSVNGTQVARATDAALTRGAVGVFTGGDGNQVLLERFTAELPDQ